jgi:hypothetical protein
MEGGHRRCNRPAARVASAGTRRALFVKEVVPPSARPDEWMGDEGVASASAGGRALGHECDRRGRRPQMRELAELGERGVLGRWFPRTLAQAAVSRRAERFRR